MPNKEITSVSFFTAAQGVFGEACVNAGSARVSEIILNDETEADTILQHLMFCVLVSKNGQTIIGESLSPSLSDKDLSMARQLAQSVARKKHSELQ